MEHKETNPEIIEKWNNGGIVWSAELGGLGPSYEQCIQLLLFELLTQWGDRAMPEDNGKEYPPEYQVFADKIAHDMDEEIGGFSGAQVEAAKVTAFQFIKFGYEKMMAKLPKDRRIQVTKKFPNYSGSKAHQ